MMEPDGRFGTARKIGAQSIEITWRSMSQDSQRFAISLGPRIPAPYEKQRQHADGRVAHPFRLGRGASSAETTKCGQRSARFACDTVRMLEPGRCEHGLH
jgi:hypothetical protein